MDTHWQSANSDSKKPNKGPLYHVAVISLPDRSESFLLGIREPVESGTAMSHLKIRTTSLLVSFDPETGHAETLNSIYQIEGEWLRVTVQPEIFNPTLVTHLLADWMAERIGIIPVDRVH